VRFLDVPAGVIRVGTFLVVVASQSACAIRAGVTLPLLFNIASTTAVITFDSASVESAINSNLVVGFDVVTACSLLVCLQWLEAIYSVDR
jgi:hypothetical protein